MTNTSLNLFELVPGNVIVGRYEIVRPHRQGGMSAMFEVTDKESGKRREMHAFPVGLFESSDQGHEFAALMLPWREFKGSCFPHVHDVHALADGSVVVVTDFPKGQPLRSWLAENARMETPEAMSIGRLMLAGLVELHAADLVHGDIKPATTFVEPGGETTLVDGGITTGLWAAKHLGTRTTLIGTPFYAPLEQFTGDSPDQLSDIYAVATVLYEVLTGSLPWVGNTYIEVFQSKMVAAPKMSERAPGVEISPDLEAVVAGGLCAKRRDRYQSAEEFLERLSVVTA